MIEPRSSRAPVIGGLILVQVLFGLHYLAAKLVLTEIPPRAWALMRVGGAASVLLALTWASGRRLPTSSRTWASLALYSLFGVVINQVCFIEGLSRTTPTHSSLINTTIPINTLVIAILLGRERLKRHRVAALAVAFAGVLLVIRPGGSGLADPLLAGDALTWINAMSFSLFLVLSKRLITGCDPLAASALLLGLGTLGVAVVGLPQLLGADLGAVSTTTWWLVVFIILGPTAGAYLINYWALARVDSSGVAFFILLQPVIATALSMTFLHERPAPSVYAGAALILLGVSIELRFVPAKE